MEGYFCRTQIDEKINSPVVETHNLFHHSLSLSLARYSLERNLDQKRYKHVQTYFHIFPRGGKEIESIINVPYQNRTYHTSGTVLVPYLIKTNK